MRVDLNDRKWLTIAGLILLLYFLPFVILGEDHYLVIHDFLDSSLAHIKSIKDSGAWFDRDAVLPILGGVSRSDFGTPFNVEYLLFALLAPYWGSVANLFLIKLTALLGMFLLLRGRLLKDAESKAVALPCIAFMLVPFYPDYGISSAGIPLLAWAFMELFDEENGALFSSRKLAALAAVLYFGAYSSLVLSGVFAGLILGCAFIAVWIRTKHFSIPAFFSLVALAAMYGVGNWWLIQSFFASGGEPMHRVEFITSKGSLLVEMVSTLALSQYHAGICPALVIITAFLIISRKDSSAIWFRRSLFILMGLIVGGYLSQILLSDVTLFRQFQFSRFYFLYPALCFALLGYLLNRWYIAGKKVLMTVFACFVAIFCLARDPNVIYEFSRINNHEPSFKDYYDTALFDSIQGTIDRERIGDSRTDSGRQTKVACLGLMPSVAQYNGFWTVDGYFFSYPLSYKHRWRQVIQMELDKDPQLASYFDDWGSRCYLFCSELGCRPNCGKSLHKTIRNLSIDTASLSMLGCEYIISAVEIPDSDSHGLFFRGDFEGRWWHLYLYRITR